MIDRFDKETVKHIRNQVLEQVNIPGVVVEFGGGSFSEGEYSLKLKMTLENPAEGVLTQEEKLYLQAAEMLGLKPLGETFTHGAETFEIVGWNNKARKYPVIAKRVLDGAMFKFPEKVAKIGG